MGWVDALIVVGVVVLAAWLVLLAVLLVLRPEQSIARELLRFLPDVLRLVRRLVADRDLPRGVRVRMLVLLAYLAMPVDIVPDFIPVLGYADDAIVTAIVLRSAFRRAGVDALRRHWPGTDGGFADLCRLTGLRESTDR